MKNSQKGSIAIIAIGCVMLVLGAGAFLYTNKNKKINMTANQNSESAMPAANQTPAADKDSASNTRKFKGEYLSFSHPENWKVEEDEQYGMITITRYDKDERPDVEYTINRSEFDRDSKEPYRKFLLEYAPFLENITTEMPVTVSGKLEGTGTDVLVAMQDESVKTTALFSVIHFKMPKPYSEYFDAITLSGYRADTVDGVRYFTQEDIAEVQDFMRSIDIVY